MITGDWCKSTGAAFFSAVSALAKATFQFQGFERWPFQKHQLWILSGKFSVPKPNGLSKADLHLQSPRAHFYSISFLYIWIFIILDSWFILETFRFLLLFVSSSMSNWDFSTFLLPSQVHKPRTLNKKFWDCWILDEKRKTFFSISTSAASIEPKTRQEHELSIWKIYNLEQWPFCAALKKALNVDWRQISEEIFDCNSFKHTIVAKSMNRIESEPITDICTKN